MIRYLPWIIITLILGGLILRFVNPELLYSVRQLLVKIGMKKVFLDRKAGRDDVSGTYNRLLIKDFRYETVGNDWVYALRRVNKIRELYSTLDWQREEGVPGLPREERKPQDCIIELANLLGNLGGRVQPEMDIDHKTVKAGDILRLIGNEIKDPTTGPLAEDGEVERWFMEHPVSIEQVIEVLIAAVFCLSYRQQLETPQAEPVTGNIGFNFRRKPRAGPARPQKGEMSRAGAGGEVRY